MVFRVGPFVGVIYTFGLDDPEGNTQAYTRLLAAVDGEADAGFGARVSSGQ